MFFQKICHKNNILTVYNIGADRMTKRKIYARELFRKFDFYHLAKELYYYIFRYPELEAEPEWKEIKEFAEEIIVTHRCSREYGDKLDPDDYRDFLRFYTRLEMRDYDKEREFIFTEKDKMLFLAFNLKKKR